MGCQAIGVASKCEDTLQITPAIVWSRSMMYHKPRSPLTMSVPHVRLTEIRAAQRTFEGAYMRTALSQFSFALIILKIFTSEFYAIGALFAAYGAAVLLVAIFRRYEGNSQFFDREESDSELDEDEGEEGMTMGQHSLDGHNSTLAGESRRRVSIRKKFRYGPTLSRLVLSPFPPF